MSIPTEKIIEDAEVTAVYFRQLLARDVPITAAISLAGSYLQTRAIVENANRQPKEPWEGDAAS